MATNLDGFDTGLDQLMEDKAVHDSALTVGCSNPFEYQFLGTTGGKGHRPLVKPLFQMQKILGSIPTGISQAGLGKTPCLDSHCQSVQAVLS